jgi:1,4-alpha-glucan branching enzyme
MDFVLALHTHLPYVLNHGRWPHGSDWLSEAVLDTYLPLLEVLTGLEHEQTATPVTIGITPVLANQLASPDLRTELAAFFEQRLAAARDVPAELLGTPDEHLIPVAHFWHDRMTRLIRYYESIDGDLVGTFRGLMERGRLELISSAATHAFLPLLGTDESIRLQLDVGRNEFRRLFGTEPRGIWLPECAYRPRGAWRPFPDSPDGPYRAGIEEHVAGAGYEYFFVDAHMARAGAPLGLYGRRRELDWADDVAQAWTPGDARNTPYRAYRVSETGHGPSVAALVRDPRSSAQVWSRHGGYPGEQWYMEFHKTRWPGGLKFWRVSAPGSDLGDKLPYEPQRAFARAVAHGRDFTALLTEVAAREQACAGSPGVIVAPFDTELFGHWWFEGPEFLASMWRTLRQGSGVHAVTAGAHVRRSAPQPGLALAPGSWGKNGDWMMWNGPDVAWTWSDIWRLEEAFWDMAPAALKNESARPVLAQAARSLLLAQSSDWQFIISTGEADDYAIKRFKGHVSDTQGLLQGLRYGQETGDWDGVRRFAEQLLRRDNLFPDILESLERISQTAVKRSFDRITPDVAEKVRN